YLIHRHGAWNPTPRLYTPRLCFESGTSSRHHTYLGYVRSKSAYLDNIAIKYTPDSDGPHIGARHMDRQKGLLNSLGPDRRKRGGKTRVLGSFRGQTGWIAGLSQYTLTAPSRAGAPQCRREVLGSRPAVPLPQREAS